MNLEPLLEWVWPPETAAWDALTAGTDDATVFHTSAWAKLWVDEWPGSRWAAIVLRDGAGYAAGLGFIVREGLLGRTVLSMPYATYGGPLVRRGHPDPAGLRRKLLDGYARFARAGRVLRSELVWYQGIRSELPQGVAASESFTHVRPLAPDFGVLMSALPHSVRSRVRQAEQHGLSMRPAIDAGGVRAFHEFAVRTVTRRGGHPKPLSLYQRIFERLVPAGLARYDLVDDQGAVIAGSLHFLHRGVATNWLTVADEQHLRLRPNHLIIAGVLRDLCDADFREYNFGGSPPDAAGLISFKEDWGATRRSVIELRHRSIIHRLLRR